MTKFVVGGVVVCALCSLAIADDDDNDNYAKYDVPREAQALKNPAPAAGVDKATLTGPAWCPPLKEKPRTYSFGSHLSSYYAAPEVKGYELMGAASSLCHNDPKNPTIQKAATEVLQLEMNRTGLNQADAVEAIKLWSGERDYYEAEQKKLCQALTLDDEVEGAARAFMVAKRELFDCGAGDSNQVSTTGPAPASALVHWFDSSATPPDELVRLMYVQAESHSLVKATDNYATSVLPNYAIDQIDYKLLQPKAALAMLDQAPYKGNAYASVVIKSTIGEVKLNMLAIDDKIQKITAKDADWKSILIDAPQKGAADWLAGAGKYKAELQRSAEFEAAAYGPSKKAYAGCQEPLKKDLVGILKSLKHETVQQLVDEMNAHPVAGLLFRRYEACVGGAGDGGVAAAMSNLKGLRVVRGPRAAAYYATIDAIGKVRADRAKFPIDEHDVAFMRRDPLHDLAFNLRQGNKNPGVGGYDIESEQGVVKTATKTKEGMKVVFAKDKQDRYIETDCVTTNRIVTFDISDGRPIYYRKCKGSVQKVDVSPDPINIPAHLTEGVGPGKMLSFGVANTQDKRVSMPREVYADKKGKKLVAWYGMGL